MSTSIIPGIEDASQCVQSEVPEEKQAGAINLKSEEANGSKDPTVLQPSAEQPSPLKNPDFESPIGSNQDGPEEISNPEIEVAKFRKAKKKEAKAKAFKELIEKLQEQDSSSGLSDGTDIDSLGEIECADSSVEFYNSRWFYNYYKNQTRNFRSDNSANISMLKEKAPKRLRQYKDYTKLVEARLSWVEQKLAGLEAAGKPEPEPVSEELEPAKKPKRISNIPKLNRVKWSTFKLLGRESEEEKEVHAIDVLVGEPTIYNQPKKTNVMFEMPDNPWAFRVSNEKSEKIPESEHTKSSAHDSLEAPNEQTQLPERIRINSLPIIRTLEKIQDEEITGGDQPVIFFRPYRILLHYEDGIREWVKRLEYKLADESERASSSTEANPEKDKKDTAPSSNKNSVSTSDIEGATPKESEGNIFEFPPHTGTKEALDDLNCLIEFLDTDIKKRVDLLKGSTHGKIFFSDIWHIFKPGDEVVGANNRGTLQMYRVIQITGVRHHTNYANESRAFWRPPPVPITLHCNYLDFNGRTLGPVNKNISIHKFDGQRDIRSLPVYPLHYSQLRSEVRENLVKRGQLFMKLARVGHIQFTGVTLDAQEEVDSQAVIDFEQTLQHNSTWEPNIAPVPTNENKGPEEVEEVYFSCSVEDCCNNEYWHNDCTIDSKRFRESQQLEHLPMLYSKTLQTIDENEGLREDELVLLNPRLFGFILRSRKWASISITDVKEVKTLKDEEGFDLLVLPPGHKSMVRSLVEQHFAEKESGVKQTQEVDLVRGKGKGLIILLHGAPGVGKTSTAECVADSFNKPLYPITCGDLGVTATEVETRLETSFNLAHKWGCILLLDEADIFLAERTKDDFLRNSLVSVFLRVLEYYAGILFLTTNRVGSFDEAFKSRIHISLYYPPLDELSTIKIWEMNIARTKLRKKNENFIIRDGEIIEYARRHWQQNKEGRWNGRQIRNAFQTAIALAEFEAGKSKSDSSSTPPAAEVRKEHFETVAIASLDFDNYLKGVYGGTSQSKRAYELNNRHDNYKPQVYSHPYDRYPNPNPYPNPYDRPPPPPPTHPYHDPYDRSPRGPGYGHAENRPPNIPPPRPLSSNLPPEPEYTRPAYSQYGEQEEYRRPSPRYRDDPRQEYSRPNTLPSRDELRQGYPPDSVHRIEPQYPIKPELERANMRPDTDPLDGRRVMGGASPVEPRGQGGYRSDREY